MSASKRSALLTSACSLVMVALLALGLGAAPSCSDSTSGSPGKDAAASICPPGLNVCENVCHDYLNDVSACGMCGMRCGQGDLCVQGVCQHVYDDGGASMNPDASVIRRDGAVSLDTNPDAPPVVPQHLKYFGYYHLDRRDGATLRDHVAAVIALGDNNVGALEPARLTVQTVSKELRKRDFFIFIDLGALMTGQDKPFASPPCSNNDGGCGQGRLRLRSDMDNAWAELKAAIIGWDRQVYGFFLDRPYFSGLPQNELDRLMNDYVKKDFPTARRIAMESSGVLGLAAVTGDAGAPPSALPQVPVAYLKGFTDVGVRGDEPCAGATSPWSQHLGWLATNLPDAALWMSPNTVLTGADLAGRSRAAALNELATKWSACADLAMQNARVVGIYNYTFDAAPDTTADDRTQAADATFTRPGWGEISNPMNPFYSAELVRQQHALGLAIIKNAPRQQ